MAVSSVEDNGPGKPTNPTGLSSSLPNLQSVFAASLLYIPVLHIWRSLASVAKGSRTQHVSLFFSVLATRTTPEPLGCLVNGHNSQCFRNWGSKILPCCGSSMRIRLSSSVLLMRQGVMVAKGELEDFFHKAFSNLLV